MLEQDCEGICNGTILRFGIASSNKHVWCLPTVLTESSNWVWLVSSSGLSRTVRPPFVTTVTLTGRTVTDSSEGGNTVSVPYRINTTLRASSSRHLNIEIFLLSIFQKEKCDSCTAKPVSFLFDNCNDWQTGIWILAIVSFIFLLLEPSWSWSVF